MRVPGGWIYRTVWLNNPIVSFVKCQFFDKQDTLYARDFAKGTLKKIKKLDVESTMPVFK